jgi:hypothetical protein
VSLVNELRLSKTKYESQFLAKYEIQVYYGIRSPIASGSYVQITVTCLGETCDILSMIARSPSSTYVTR